ncbi:MAG: hypothetical protein WB615_09730 [Candidatus Tumulicola sp.]
MIGRSNAVLFSCALRGLLGTAVLATAISGCNAAQQPKWTLWYIPNEPKVGVTLSKLCHTFIFASAPDAKNFRVVTVKHIVGGKVGEAQAYLQAGDSFSGPLELGPATIHDESTGYDLNVDVVYQIEAYTAAKARADADCPPPVRHAVVVRPSPKASSVPSPKP